MFQGWLARHGGATVGAAPGHPPVRPRLAQPADDGVLPAIADAVDDDLPRVVGAVPEVDELASHWAARRDVRATTVVEQRIYALTLLLRPPPIPGVMRLAAADDRELVLGWSRAFAAELRQGDDDEGRIERSVDARLAGGADGGIGLWRSTASLSRSPATAARRRTGSGSAPSTRRRSTVAGDTAA